MNTAVGKPILALMAAGVIAVPASTEAASVETGRTFHPLPAELSVTAPVELTALSYPNLFGLAVAVGNAAFAGLDIVFLPLSVGYLAANLQSGAIPAYVAGVEKVVTGAIPGLAAALHALFGGLGPLKLAAVAPAAVKPAALAPVSHTAAVTPAATPLSLYAGLFNLATAIGNAAFAGLDIVFLPLSVGYLAANLQSGAIPAYLAGVEKVVTGALPGLAAALQALFGGFGKLAPVKAAAVHTPSVTSTVTPSPTKLVTLSTVVTPSVTPSSSSVTPSVTVTPSNSLVKLDGTKKKHTGTHTTSGTTGSTGSTKSSGKSK